MKKYLLHIFISSIFTNCYSGKSSHVSVIEYVKVGENYQYSNILFFNKNKYKPIIKSVYLNDSIESVSIFKSEGEMYYDKTELKNDSLLMSTFKIVEIRNIKQSNSNIIDNNNVYNIIEQKKDSFFCTCNEKLYVFVF